MKNLKTTIILGAGASVHYGFPTGNQLIDQIIKSSSIFNWYIIGGDFYLNDIPAINKFGRALRSYDPMSIDSFLSMHANDQKIITVGKQLIAHTIIKKQNPFLSTRDNKQNWYRYLYDFVFPGSDYISRIENNDFRIITFNYDLSLEHFFHSRLEKTPSLSHDKAWEIFQKFNSKVHHVYGSVYDYETINTQVPLCGTASSERYAYPLRYAEKASHSPFQETSQFHNNIKVIGEERNDALNEDLSEYKNYLKNSDRIFILGFGFDKTNVSLIELDKIDIQNNPKYLFCTNYGNTRIINQKISGIFNHTNWRICTSDKSVYSALLDDFSF